MKKTERAEPKRREFLAMVTDKAKWLAKDLSRCESVTLEGPTAFLTEPGYYHVVLTPKTAPYVAEESSPHHGRAEKLARLQACLEATTLKAAAASFVAEVNTAGAYMPEGQRAMISKVIAQLDYTMDLLAKIYPDEYVTVSHDGADEVVMAGGINGMGCQSFEVVG